MSRLDYIILHILDSNNAKSSQTGMTINEISEVEGISSVNITIYKRVMALLKLEYVRKGVKAGKADTFYITENGLKIKLEGV